MLAVCLHPLISPRPLSNAEAMATGSNEAAVQALGKVILQAHMEEAVMGSWSWSLATVIILPLWLFTWSGLLLADF